MGERRGGTVACILWPAILAAGLVLVALMITTEGELGALPLGLILAGAIGSAVTRSKRRGA